jgi:hypothetical protein
VRRAFPRRFVLTAAALAAAVLSPVTTASPTVAEPAAEAAPSPEAASSPGTPFTSSPAEGVTGTRIEVAGDGCLLPRSHVPGEGVVVRLKSQGRVVGFVTIPVQRDGSWTGTLEVFAGTPVRTHDLEARCVYPDEPDPVVYRSRTFTVTGEGANAESTPRTPALNGGIEPFPEYDGQSTCSPDTKPGMAAFMRIVFANYGGGSLGVGRACGAGGQSEHKEGRAWDWANNAGSAADRARVQSFFNWLFATDAQCNRFAVARRIGIMYMIWNHRMFRMYDVDRGWAPYSGSSPHTDHVHISLTRNGGAGRVSWYNPVYQAPRGWTSGRHEVADARVGPQWDTVTPKSGDFDGDGFDDLLWYDTTTNEGATVWFSRGGRGRFVARHFNMGPGRTPIIGDFNGDCRADVFWYRPGADADRQWQGVANRTFRSVAATMDGTYQYPIPGDFNGDRTDDIYWYNPGEGADRLWQGTPYGFRARNASNGGTYEPFPGDFNGDFKDDIFWYGPGGAPDKVWYGKANGFTPHNANYAQDREPVPGDYNGDDRTDILWYGVGELGDRLWIGGSNRGFTSKAVDAGRPYASAVAADIDGDTFDDLFWHASPVHEDRLWLF